MKRCCSGERRLETCADCPEHPECETIGAFHRIRGYEYRRYGRSTDYNRENGYPRSISSADGWNGAYGRLG